MNDLVLSDYYTHNINPVIFSLGPVSVYWYGLMYVISILLAWRLLTYRSRAFDRGTFIGWHRRFSTDSIDDMIFWAAVSLMVGGRLGSMLFYYPGEFFSDPLSFFRIQEGGMSFHGGLLGVIIGLVTFCRLRKLPWREVADILATVTPIGLFFGRIGNFINGELWGKTTDVPWAVIFTNSGGGPLPRHPSMLYEALLEGLLLFIILWTLSKQKRRPGQIFGLFLLLYGIFRFLIEFVREPDAHLGYLLWGWVTQGQILSLPMIIGGIALILLAPKMPAVSATHK